jgi:hypothetical protein
MRSYFPFTDFDFYAYVLAGFLALVCFDYAFLDGAWLLHDVNWTIAYGAGVVASSYIAGQIVSMIASFTLEKQVVCKWIGPPREYLLGVRTNVPTLVRFINGLSASHISPTLPSAIATKAMQNAAVALGEQFEDFRGKDTRSEEVFQYGYAIGRCHEDTCRRLDRDRREYELSRNLALVSLVGGGLLLVFPRAAPESWPGPLLLLLSCFMLIRFVRYFASFHTQVIREAAFAHLKGPAS